MSSLKFSGSLSVIWSFATAKIGDFFRIWYRDVVTVATKSGPVKGYRLPSSFDFHYINFFGIPYAKPPVGDLRFKDPQPFEPSNDVINLQFQRDGSMACQSDVFLGKPSGAENCLHLSVFTRDVKPDVLKPVMVWIHGGGFVAGSNAKDFSGPDYLLRNDVVVIAINYRLGAFGFLSLSDPELKVPGNAGLKDQSLALKWVKENCADFGGDPNNITVFGISAGGASVHYHMVSEMSKGLFDKAIVMSGAVYSPWAFSSVKDWTQRLSQKLGWNGEGGDKACLAVLQKASPGSIIKAQDSLFTPEDQKNYVFFAFGPSVEPYESEQCFLPKDPKLLAKNAWSKNIPVVIGACSDEGLLFHNTLKDALKNADLAYAVPYDELELEPKSEKCQELGQSIQKFYFGFSPITSETIWTYLMLLGDTQFTHPIHRAVLARLKENSAATYVYRFNFESLEQNFPRKFVAGKDARGVCHGDDMGYVFKAAFLRVPSRASKEWKTVERMCECWTQFARTGNPNNDIIAPVEWKPIELTEKDVEKSAYQCLNIAEEVTFIDSPELERMYFWDDLLKQKS